MREVVAAEDKSGGGAGNKKVAAPIISGRFVGLTDKLAACGEITDPIEFESFINSLSFIGDEPAVQVITNSIQLPEYLSGAERW